MTKGEYLLVCVVEECAEVQKEAMKCLRFGMDNCLSSDAPANKQLLLTEMMDLVAVIDMLSSEFPTMRETEDEVVEKFIQEKKAKVEKFMEYSRSIGRVDNV